MTPEIREILKTLVDTEPGESSSWSEQHYQCVFCKGCMDNHWKPSGQGYYQCRPRHTDDCIITKAAYQLEIYD